MSAKKGGLDWLKGRPVAHRGLFNPAEGIPENSVKAFDAAASAGYPIECDVRVLRCGTLVVFHDETLKRMTGVPGIIYNVSYHDVESLTLGGTAEGIPHFSDLLAAVKGRVPLMIEIKNETKLPRLGESLVEGLRHYTGEYSVHSFDPADVEWFARNAPDITRGMVFENFTDAEFDHAMKIAKPDFVVFYTGNFPRELVARLRKEGKPVMVYTVKSAAEAAPFAKTCDNIIFEGFKP